MPRERQPLGGIAEEKAFQQYILILSVAVTTQEKYEMEVWRKQWAEKKWGIVFGITSVLAVLLLLGTATFIFDVKDTRFVPMNSLRYHNCFTAYAAAAYLASTGTVDLYNPIHYNTASSYSTPIHEAVREIFPIDDFEYPPPFLLLPYGLLVMFKDFFAMRTAWFLLTVIFFITALAGVAAWCGAFRSQPRLLLFPLLLCAPTVLTTLQICNVHVLILAISLLAMIAFEEDHPLVGGVLLGFATVAKIWPAILIVYLIVQRRWRRVFYCVIAMTIFVLGGLLLFGLAPYQNFLAFQLPRLSSGEAFDFMARSPREIVFNISIFGIPHKLYALHLLASQPKLLSPVLNWSFIMLIGLVVVAAGLRLGTDTKENDNDRLIKVQLWLTLLTLVQLRSPFLPWIYGVISTLWLLLLLAPTMNGWKLGVIGVAWVALAINLQVTSNMKMASFDLGYTLFASLFIYGAILVSLYKYYQHAYCSFRVCS